MSIASAILFCCCGSGNTDDSVLLVPESQLHEGDLAFRRGSSLNSNAVVMADKAGAYSHVGILTHTDDGWRVIHAVPQESDETQGVERVKMDSLGRFFGSDRCKAGAIMRFIDDSAAVGAARKATEYFEREVRFDGGYDLRDSVRLYCTELVYRAFLWQGVDVTGGRRSRMPGRHDGVIFPSDIIDNDSVVMVFSF